MADTTKSASDASRRTFLKVGAAGIGGLVVGAAAAYVAKPSTTSTTTQTTTVPTTVTSTSPGSTVTTTLPGTTATSTLTTTLPPSTVTVTGSNQTTTVTGPTTTATTTTTVTNSSASVQLDELSAFLTLNTTEQAELTAICAAIIPTDSTGPGANEAGCAYFIDRQLKGIYGYSGNVYTDGPFIPANTQGSITVDGVTYSGSTYNVTVAGTPYSVVYPTTGNVRVGAGTRFQYAWDMREFWRVALAGVETYANAAYGGNFETLSAANQTACLNDLWNNKPTAAQFGGILPSDFAFELFFMTWAGFTMDPIYGGNKGMVGWTYTGFNGANQGNFYGEGYTTKQIMVTTAPIVLGPVALGQFQKGSP